MRLVEVISRLKAENVRIWRDGDGLRYSAPPGGLTPELKDLLSKRKDEILTFLDDSSSECEIDLPITAVPRTTELFLSFAQERLWFLDQLKPGLTAYNVPSAVRIEGPLVAVFLERAINEIVRRHEVLRTTFEVSNGQSRQRIEAEQCIPLRSVDLSALAKEERQRELERLIAECVGASFDLAKGPLLRASLFQLGSQEHVLLLTMHHIVCDAWSMGIFITEASSIYEALVNGKRAALPELPIQYADFALWQRELFKGKNTERHLDYWRRVLQGAPETLELSTSNRNPTLEEHAGAVERVTVVREETLEKLKQVGYDQGATLYMILLAAFRILLWRYTAQEEMVVGTVMANRGRKELENLIGFFVNLLPLRGNVSGNPTFIELLQREKGVLLDAQAHQDIPFTRLVQEVQGNRQSPNSPLFQVVLVLQNAPGAVMSVSHLRFSSMEVPKNTTDFDIVFNLLETHGGLTAEIQYRTDLFDGATIRGMAAHFSRLLEQIPEHLDQCIEELSLLSQEERKEIPAKWNQDFQESLRQKCVHELFEEIVGTFQGSTALELGMEFCTYERLNARANRLANFIVAAGIRPEMRVGICAECSVEMIVGVLAVMKAGAAFVPLDTAYPRDRIEYMVRDAEIDLLLIQQKFAEEFSQFGRQMAFLDGMEFSEYSERNLNIPIEGENAAYVIYTSGSTGQPKGVTLTHRSLSNVIQAHVKDFNLRPQDRVLKFVSFSFDVSVAEVFVALTSGATLCLGNSESLLPGQNLAHFLRDKKISLAMMPASCWAVIAGENFPDLKTIVSGGESCAADVVSRLAPGRLFVNAYGPTETTICATFDFCQPGEEMYSIGKPISNTCVYVLNSNLEPVPVGVKGEIYIGGSGVGRGYIGRPDLTADRFVPDPFSRVPGTRLYRTGDFARCRPSDGKILFIDRVDQQVKIRGFRIELGEIESALQRCGLVRQAVVVAHTDSTGGRKLVAYIVLDTSAPAVARVFDQLRETLSQQLPEYMVPSVFVALERLPLTANGKINRRALPAPQHLGPTAEEYVAPRNLVEQTMAQIWSDLLKVERVGIHDNFFRIGGHSLLVSKLVARLRDAFGVEIPLQKVFVLPTIAKLSPDLAALIEDRARYEVEKQASMRRLRSRIDQMSAEEIKALLQVKSSPHKVSTQLK